MTSVNERAVSGQMVKAGESVKDEPEGFITKPTVARRIQKCTRTVDNLMARGLPHFKVGRSVIFRWSEVEAYLVTNCRVGRRVEAK